jgi:hypothetical protein
MRILGQRIPLLTPRKQAKRARIVNIEFVKIIDTIELL